MSVSFLLKKARYLLLTGILSGVLSPCFSSSYQIKDTLNSKPRTLTAEDMIRGERLFFGLAYPDARSVNCAGCHNTRVSDSLNWNPDALEISTKYYNKTADDLGRVLLKPAGVKMKTVHREFELTPEDIILLKAYLDKFSSIGLTQDKPVITNLLLFIIASLLFLFSITDLTITKFLKRKWINQIILSITGIFITWILVVDAIALGRSEGYSPDQPVKFSHMVHAGQNQTDCFYCHGGAKISKSAGIPAENVCMNCHLLVRNGSRSGGWEISKVITSFEKSQPVKWIKIHNLPDHVFFSHAQHISQGGIDCQECHGVVKSMNVVVQVKDLSMGWCIDCHNTKKVNFMTNNFFTDYKKLSDKIRRNVTDSVTVTMLGGKECMRCHY